MSARRLSIERTMTLASFGGPAGAAGAAEATGVAAGVAPVGAGGVVEDAAATVGVCEPGWAGGVSLEHAAPRTATAAATAETAKRCIEAIVFTSTPTPTQAFRQSQDSTVICSFWRISRYSSLML
jgi:hypothetical protein